MSGQPSPVELTGDYTLDPTHTRIGFVARHAMITKVRGSFNDVTGTGHFDAKDVSKSHLTVEIDALSIDTRNADRDEQLRSNDFFDMPTYPTIRFVSASVAEIDSEHFTVTGGLTIKGVTRSIVIPFKMTGAATDPLGNDRISFEGRVVVNRKDWGVNWNAALEAGGVLVGERATLDFEVSAIKNV